MTIRDILKEFMRDEKAKFFAKASSALMLITGAIFPAHLLFLSGWANHYLSAAFFTISTVFVLKYILEAREAYIRKKALERVLG